MPFITTKPGKGALIAESEDTANHNATSGLNVATASIYTIDQDNQNDTIEVTANVEITLQAIGTITGGATPIHTTDMKVIVKATHSDGCTVVTSSTDTFDDTTTTKTLLQYDWICLQIDSTGALWNVIGSSDAYNLGGQPAANYLRSDSADSANGVIDFINSIKFAGTIITASGTEVNVLDGAIEGEVHAGKALIASALKKVYGFSELGATTFVGALTGNATTATTATLATTATAATAWDSDKTVELTGDVTGSTTNASGSKSIATTLTSSAVGSKTASLSVGDIGTYAFLLDYTASTRNPGDTLAGSNLRYASTSSSSATSPSGTWQCMGFSSSAGNRTLWMRIS